MSGQDFKIVHPSGRIGGVIRPPGDKSISHRAAMLGALASGTSIFENYLVSEDCLNTLHAVQRLGATVAREGDTVKIRGTGGLFKASPSEIDMGNSGTGIRLLSGLLAGHPFVSLLTGDASLRSRPMRRIKEPLERMGAKVELLGPKDCAPIRITGRRIRGIDYELPMASAQVKSCVLLAGILAQGRTTVVEPKPTRDHTERMLRMMGLAVATDGLAITVEGAEGATGVLLQPMNMAIPGDFSSAAFWMMAAAGREGAEITLENVGLNPRRTAFMDVLRRMGADVEVKGKSLKFPPVSGDKRRKADEAFEPAGIVTVRGGKLRGTEVGGEEIPNLIDELPLVAVAGALAEGRTAIRDAAELRVKESDRIATMAKGLQAFGVKVEETPDGMIVTGGGKIRGGAEVETLGDHRIAMALAILTLSADAAVRINDVSFVSTSYPAFWKDLEKATSQHMAER